MSFSRISEQAIEMQHTKEAEFYRLLIHSLLHLVGYDHEEDQDHLVMLPKERTIINFLNEKYQLSIVI
jgi:probable rRNA maturation factor